jgi:F0F1-type ATP synthase assembly protein I
MEPERTPAREIGVGYTHAGLGCTFAGGIVGFMAVGWFLDRWLRLTPLFTIIGTLVGSTLSILWVYLKLRAEAEAEKKRRAEKRQ